MAQETNWHKQVAIGTWILVALTLISIGLALASYIWPPDPTQPVKFDFLSKSLVIPLWWVIVGVLIAAIAYILTTLRRRRSSPALPARSTDSGLAMSGSSRVENPVNEAERATVGLNRTPARLLLDVMKRHWSLLPLPLVTRLPVAEPNAQHLRLTNSR
jgi:hypothetical protein